MNGGRLLVHPWCVAFGRRRYLEVRIRRRSAYTIDGVWRHVDSVSRRPVATSTNPRGVLSPDDVDELLRGVDGWFGPHEGRLLYRLAASADPRGAIVEIGSWQGRSTTWLAAGALAGRGARVVAIDPHIGTALRAPGDSTEAALRGTLERAGVSEHVDVVVATSEATAAGWSEAISLLWIDGDHSYEAAARDLALWEPYLREDATVAFHDTFVCTGPEDVVREHLVRSRRYTAFEHAETTTAARRCGALTLRGRVDRTRGLARRSFYGVRLRAYDRNTLGFARLWDTLARG